MQHKPDVTPRTAAGIPAEIISVPAIAEAKGLASPSAHIRMDPRVLDRIHNVVSVLEKDYADVLAGQVEDLKKAASKLTGDNHTATTIIYAVAHDIRGVAGTFSRPLAGRIAAHICEFLDECSKDLPALTHQLQEKVDVLVQVANLSPEPDGVFASVIMERLNETVSGNGMAPLAHKTQSTL
jgi:hypothetical protein